MNVVRNLQFSGYIQGQTSLNETTCARHVVHKNGVHIFGSIRSPLQELWKVSFLTAETLVFGTLGSFGETVCI